MKQRPYVAERLRRKALREQRGRVSHKINVRFVEPKAKRTGVRTVSTAPLSEDQRVLLGELRREHKLPRHGIAKLTKAQAAVEIDALIKKRRSTR